MLVSCICVVVASGVIFASRGSLLGEVRGGKGPLYAGEV